MADEPQTDRIRSHGWVTPLPSGAVARCGGPAMCSHCQLERLVLAERRHLGDALDALTLLLAAVNVATLDDPSKHRVANTVAGPALVARQILDKHGRLDDLNRAVRERYGPPE